MASGAGFGSIGSCYERLPFLHRTWLPMGPPGHLLSHRAGSRPHVSPPHPSQPPLGPTVVGPGLATMGTAPRGPPPQTGSDGHRGRLVPFAHRELSARLPPSLLFSWPDGRRRAVEPRHHATGAARPAPVAPPLPLSGRGGLTQRRGKGMAHPPPPLPLLAGRPTRGRWAPACPHRSRRGVAPSLLPPFERCPTGPPLAPEREPPRAAPPLHSRSPLSSLVDGWNLRATTTAASGCRRGRREVGRGPYRPQLAPPWHNQAVQGTVRVPGATRMVPCADSCCAMC